MRPLQSQFSPACSASRLLPLSVSGAYTAQDTFVAKIVDLNEHIPPDPVATDTNPGYSVPPLPNETQKLTANWGVWSCYWVPVWVWCDHGEDGGHWVDEGYWEYEYTGYSASISGEMSLMPDDIVPTASGKTMKSGYGVKTEVRATLSTDAPTSHITYPQTAFSVFPEFQYQTYLRLLQRSGGQSAKFIFKPNEFSTYDRTVHFTPLWFPDATDYTIYTQVWDTWTPDGMLSINLALKELLSQKVTSILILIAVVLSTMMTTIVGQSIGVLSAMREQQAIAIGGNRYATFLQMNADQLHALEQDERLSYVGKSIYMGSLELSPSLTLGLMEYLDDNAAIYPSSTSVEEGRLPEAPMEIALSEDILKYLGFEGGIGDKITLSLQKNLRHNIADSYSYTAEFVLTGILRNNYLGYTSGTVTGVVGEGTAEQLLPESYIYYNVDIQTADKKSFQAVVDDINKELNIHELDTSYNIVYLNALGILYTANSEDANDKGFSFMTVAGILVGTLILLAAGLVIYNILKISVSKRIKGYGTLRAIGGEKGQLYQIIVIEVILLCLMGIPIGMLLGFLSARGILEAATGLVSPELFLVQDASELKTLIAENSSLNGTLLVLSGAITLAFALFAALPAARSAARVSPIMAMSGTNLKILRRKRKTKKIHNFEAYYARLNLKRNKGRTAITILSLVMSITVFIALQGYSSLLNAASALQDNHLGDYQITNESVGFTTDDLNTLRKNEAVQSVAAIQFSLYEQNENGLLDEISLEFQLKPGETFQVVGLNDEYWDYFMGDQLPEEQLGQLKSGNACIVRNPIPMSYGEDVLEFTNIEAGENICVAGMELNVLKTLDGYDGYLGIGNGGFTNGVQVIVDDAIYERLTGKDTYSEFLPTLNEGADRENFDTFIEAFCNRIPGTTFLSYEETDQQLKESFAQIQMLAWGLILFVGLIGILNIINTVYTNIHTRVTEIGMQRAIGMSADSLYKTFLWEGAYYGIIASVIGSVLGYVCTIFIEAATSDTIQLVAIPVMPILEATLLAVGACLLATAIPLRKISKMSIVDSIETVE